MRMAGVLGAIKAWLGRSSTAASYPVEARGSAAYTLVILRSQMLEDKRWLREFPVASEIITRYLRISTEGARMPSIEPAEAFRDRLRSLGPAVQQPRADDA